MYFLTVTVHSDGYVNPLVVLVDGTIHSNSYISPIVIICKLYK